MRGVPGGGVGGRRRFRTKTVLSGFFTHPIIHSARSTMLLPEKPTPFHVDVFTVPPFSKRKRVCVCA